MSARCCTLQSCTVSAAVTRIASPVFAPKGPLPPLLATGAAAMVDSPNTGDCATANCPKGPGVDTPLRLTDGWLVKRPGGVEEDGAAGVDGALEGVGAPNERGAVVGRPKGPAAGVCGDGPGVGAPKARGAGKGQPKGPARGVCGEEPGVGAPKARGVMEAEPKGPGLLLGGGA